jgi:hypothetical protein
VVAPIIIIWVKTVIFYNLKNEIGLIIDTEDAFLIDTVVTSVSLYIYSFVVIHSLTKSFQIKKEKDPLFDVFNRSEYFHLWLSHIVTYSGILLIMLSLALLNLFSPITPLTNKIGLYTAIFIGAILGFLFYYAMWSIGKGTKGLIEL